MRQIKFRVYDSYLNKMHEHDSIYNNSVIAAYIMGKNERDREHCEKYYSPPMQFTGLTDKRGKEVYEGDIVNVTNKGSQNGVKVVVWDETTLSYCLIWLKLYSPDWNSGNSHQTYLKVTKGISCIVVGNIYEDAYLLHQGENPEVCDATEDQSRN